MLREKKLDAGFLSFIRDLTTTIHAECPGQIQSRYLARISDYRPALVQELSVQFWKDPSPLLLQGLPQFDNIELTKIMLLSIGEAIGRCAAYSEYNQSYITDIRPTGHSSELSSDVDLLSMHNDLCFASDSCRPRALVLTPHVATGEVPMTLLCTARQLVDALSADHYSTLSSSLFEIRSGGKLRWPTEQIKRISVFDAVADNSVRVRMSFDNIQPARDLSTELQNRAQEALEILDNIALRLGETNGHALVKGEALLINNDYSLHGRAKFAGTGEERLLLRTYVISEKMVANQYGNTMLSLRD